ncbi:hypothetical protein CERZMDRAFT_96535 [Cercospora zeae-maydis SCOH1-5]|uniref:Uncharacterized protein n=1 Tax=Cercospora zeae-maydis SCOH1-5 TaxID=717836 RepID=A0A6A6FK01_9PEZI|nr:hypothetical protein CERZMDRAFT_96535 [Cercospora zeae-maydis SCOH1-5]
MVERRLARARHDNFHQENMNDAVFYSPSHLCIYTTSSHPVRIHLSRSSQRPAIAITIRFRPDDILSPDPIPNIMSYLLPDANGVNGVDGVNGDGINGNGINVNGANGASRSSSTSSSGRGEIRRLRRADNGWLGVMVRAIVQREIRENRIDMEGLPAPSNTPLEQSASEDEASQSSATSPAPAARDSNDRPGRTSRQVSALREQLWDMDARNSRHQCAVLTALHQIRRAVRHIELKQDSMDIIMQTPSVSARGRAGASSRPQPQTVDVNEDENVDKARQDSAATDTNVPNIQAVTRRVIRPVLGVPVVPRRQGATFIIGPDHSDETEIDTPEVRAIYIPERSVSRRPLDQQQSEGEPREDSPTLPAPSATYEDPTPSSAPARAPEASSSRTVPSIVVEPSPSISAITTPRSWKGKGRANEAGPSGTSNSTSTNTSTSDDDDRHLVHERHSPGTQAPSHPPATPGYVDPETGIDTGMSEEEYRAYLAQNESGDSEEEEEEDDDDDDDGLFGCLFD